MMRTFFDTARRAQGFLRREQDGFLLIEVIVSAMMVSIIVVATFTGFDAVNRETADERNHDEASVLASQAQEQLRTDPASALVALESTPHTYTDTIGHTTYTISQEAKPVASSGSSTGCSATETTAQTGANIKITSKVTWATLGTTRSEKHPVSESSIITPPVGSALEVDVTNGATPPAGVAGVTAVVTYTPVGSSATTTQEGSTGSEGCVVFTGIQALSANVAIREKAGFVTTTGALKVNPKEISIAPNITTHYPVTYYLGGEVAAEFTYKGSATYTREPGGHKETVTGDTFSVFNEKINLSPNFEVGNSGGFEYESGGEEKYNEKPETEAGVYATTATTPAGPKYLEGDLFPFSSSWQASAGDCPKNDINGEATASTPAVPAGGTATVKVPMSYTLLNIWTGGTKAAFGSLATTAYPATITDTECESTATPDNASSANLKHRQMTTTEGHLEHPFQPFGTAQLCVYNKTAGKTYRISYTNLTAVGSEPNIYLAQPTKAERETSENSTRSAAEALETTTKSNREKETETKIYWEYEQNAGKITAAQRTAKEKTKAAFEAEKPSKATLEKDEKELETKAYWEYEEKTLGTVTAAQRTAKEKTKATLESEEAATRNAREETEKTARENAVTLEGLISVASGQTSC
jgi:Tfp pilus assembly protein PilV